MERLNTSDFEDGQRGPLNTEQDKDTDFPWSP